jgi:hypothetical protein
MISNNAELDVLGMRRQLKEALSYLDGVLRDYYHESK